LALFLLGLFGLAQCEVTIDTAPQPGGMPRRGSLPSGIKRVAMG